MPADHSASGSRSQPEIAEPADANALSPGTKIGEFEITSLIGAGGFGIVYLAYDHSLHRNVAIKEYMPSAFAARRSDTTVAVKSSRYDDTFKAGLRSFINEARLLAKFDHPSLVKVYRFWEANGTGYMVMPYYEGVTLKRALAERQHRPDEEWLKNLLAQLLDALEVLHRAQCFHRDIAPDNILILDDGRPLLLDFGAARRVIGDMTQALTVMLKPGYAPLEQYAESPSMKQGAWTDLYALAAVMYYAVTGQAPTPSVGRVMSDTLVPITDAGSGRYSEAFLRGIDSALAVRPENRPQNVAEFRRLLELDGRTGTDSESRAKPPLPLDPGERRARYRRWFMLAIGIAAVFVAISGGLFFWSSLQTRHIAAKAGVEADQAQPPATQTPSVEVASVPQKPGNAETPIPVPLPPVEKPLDAIAVLQEIYRGGDPQHEVTVAIENSRVRIGKDGLQFSITSSVAGYLYVFVVGTKSDFYLLFPNSVDTDNSIPAGKALIVPRRMQLNANGPPGINHFVAIVSASRRDFAVLGGRKTGMFEEFPPEALATLAKSTQGRGPPFAGQVTCPGQAQCSEVYGAVEFSIEEIGP